VVVRHRRIEQLNGDEHDHRRVVAVLAVVEDDIDVVAGVDVVDRDRERRTERLVGGAAVRGQVEDDVAAGVHLHDDVVIPAAVVLVADELDGDRIADRVRVRVQRALEADVPVRRAQLEDVRPDDLQVRAGEDVAAQVLDVRPADRILDEVRRGSAVTEADERLPDRTAERTQVLDQDVGRRERVLDVEVEGRAR
jgi:hypothetical protein